MPRIALLSENVASQVAAGEVVERPASVVKELVENSIDAGARKIEVLIRRGGISYIRVVDDGSGMDRDDALLCLERHATSKIRTGDDLAAIHTLGFRGEALPSIASVSRFRLATRERDALAGTEVIVNGGKIESVKDGGDAPGTQIEVRQLFYNLPARRKFLRTENTESSHVDHQLHLQAIGHPEIGFVFVNDERVVYQLPPATHLRERIRDLCGPALAAELLEVPEFATDNIRIRGPDPANWIRTFQASAPTPTTSVDTTLPLIPAQEQVALRRDWSALPLQPNPAATSSPTAAPSPVSIAAPSAPNSEPEVPNS